MYLLRLFRLLPADVLGNMGNKGEQRWTPGSEEIGACLLEFGAFGEPPWVFHAHMAPCCCWVCRVAIVLVIHPNCYNSIFSYGFDLWVRFYARTCLDFRRSYAGLQMKSAHYWCRLSISYVAR